MLLVGIILLLYSEISCVLVCRDQVTNTLYSLTCGSATKEELVADAAKRNWLLTQVQDCSSFSHIPV